MNAQTTATTLRASHFTMPDFDVDSVRPTVFDGYTKGESWNGFACPYFTREQGLRIVQMWNEVGVEMAQPGHCPLAAWFDEATDTFVFPMADATSLDAEEIDRFPGIDAEGLHLYPIGTAGWTWWEHTLLRPDQYSLEVHWSDDEDLQLSEEGDTRFQVVCFRMPADSECSLIYDAETDISMRVKVDPEMEWCLPKELVAAVANVNRILREQAGVVGY